MNTSASLLAEQTVFAELVIKKRETELSAFQTATLSDSNYKYAKDDQTPLTSVDPSKYSIINLPDTTAYIRKNSLFSNISLVRSNSPDPRFVPIAKSNVDSKTNKRTAVVTDSDIKTKKVTPRKKQKLFTTKYVATRNTENDGSSSDSEDNSKRPQTQTKQYENIVDFKDVDTYPNFQDVVTVPIMDILTNSQNEPDQDDDWHVALLNSYNFTSDEVTEDLNDVNATLVIISGVRNLNSEYSKKYTSQNIADIKDIIDTYIANL